MKKKILVSLMAVIFIIRSKILPQIHLTNFDYYSLAKSLVKDVKLHVVYYVGEIRQYEGNKSLRCFIRISKSYLLTKESEY